MVEYWDNSNAPLFYFPASISFIAWCANEKSLTSSSGRFFSPTRAMIASTSASVMVPSRDRVLSSLSAVIGVLGDVERLGQPFDHRLNRLLAVFENVKMRLEKCLERTPNQQRILLDQTI